MLRRTVTLAVGFLIAGGVAVAQNPDQPSPPTIYRWVRAPADFVIENEPPLAASMQLTLAAAGSPAASIGTGDGQATVVLSVGTFDAATGETAVSISLTPLDPATIGDPPAGKKYDGNAYRVEARYEPSKRSADINQRVSVVLRYVIGAEGLYRRSQSKWARVEAKIVPESLLIFGESDALGTFVAVRAKDDVRGEEERTGPLVAAGIVLGAVVIGHLARRRSRRQWSGP